MEVDYLIATMNRTEFDFLSKMNLKSNAIVINQCKIEDELIEEYENIKIISCNEIGLSKSRNKALENSKADICILADDDIEYTDNSLEIINNAYKEYDADIIVFKAMKSNGKAYKKYKNNRCSIKKINSMKVSSVEITFNRLKIINKKIGFDERFGAGAEYICGEENIFLSDCLKKGCKIIFIPEFIVKLKDSESTWFQGYNEKYFMSKGAVFYRLYKYLYPLMIIQFVIRKQTLYGRNIIGKAILYMFKGAFKVKKESDKEVNLKCL